MNLKPKTVRRLLLVSLIGVLLLGSMFSLFVVRRWQTQRLLDAYRAEGLAAYHAGDYFTAIEKTSFYYRRGNVSDAEVLLALAESRRNLEEPDSRHLVQSIRPYQLYLEQRPDDEEIRHTLLEVYNKAGYFIEARDLAARMRPEQLADAQLEHIPVLREEAFALVGAQSYGSRLDSVLERIFELSPLDVDAHMAKLEVLSRNDRRREARAWGQQTLEAHEDDPRAQIVFAASRLVHPTRAEIAEARSWLCRAAGLDPETAERLSPATYTDERYAQRLVMLLDGVRAFPHSRQVLSEAAPMFDDKVLRRSLVRRLWQESSDESVLKQTAELDPTSRESDSELLAFRALSLVRLGQSREAKQTTEALARREGDFRAEAWVVAVRLAAEDDATSDLDAVASLREAAADHPLEPVLKVLLGDRLASLGRREEARRVWTEATAMPLSASWAMPWVRLAESFLREGRVDEAVAAANEAMQIASNRVLVNVVWFEAQAARVQNGSIDGPEPGAILNRLERALVEIDGLDGMMAGELRERLLPSRVILMARTGQRKEARELAMSAAQQGTQVQTLQQLAAISVSERLDFEDGLMAHAEVLEGGSAAVAQARAMKLASEGRGDEGLALLRSAAGARPSVESRIAIARYMDSIQHSGALAEWRRIGEAHPRDLAVQHACLSAQAVAADRKFVEATIERYHRIQGKGDESEDALVRIARVRVLLHGRPTQRERDEAVGILASVVNVNPLLSEPRVLLAAALAHADRQRGIASDVERATRQLAEAARLEPRNAGIALELARLLHRKGDHGRARDQMLVVAQDDRFDVRARWRAADMLLAAGDAVTAADVLERLAGVLGEETPGSLLAALAEAHAGAGKANEARAVYERLATGAADDGPSVLATAVFLAEQGEGERAREVLVRLEGLPLSTGERSYLLGSFESRVGDAPAAAEQFELALAALPERADIWRQYATMHLNRGDARQASAVAERGLSQVPEDAGLAVLRERARFATAAGSEEQSLEPLVSALASTDMYAEAAQVLGAIEQARGRGHLESSQGLMRLGEEIPRSIALQMYVAQRLAAFDPEAAAGVAARAMNVDPRDPKPAALATELYRALERWGDMLSTARVWRAREQGGSAEADVAIAEAQWRMGRPDQGLRTLGPRISDAVLSPEDPTSLAVLNIQARMLVQSRREEEARRLLMPLLPKSESVRLLVWTGVAARDVTPLASSVEWLREVEVHMPSDSVDEHLGVAIALTMLADRFPGEGDHLLGEAEARLGDMVGTPALASAGVWEALGMLRHRNGEIDGAEEAYRRAIETEPGRAVSLHNLATIAAQLRGDLDEAVILSQRAVDAASETPPPPGHVSTLAAIHREMAQRRTAQNDLAGAQKSYRAAASAFAQLARLTPRDPGPVVQEAQALWSAGDTRSAAEAYERVLQYPGLPAEVVAPVSNNLAIGLRAGAESLRDLERARGLALEAIGLDARAEFYDTLGWIELELHQHENAARAFRTALDLSASSGRRLDTAAVGLAYTLKSGSAEEQREAARLIEGVEGISEAPYRVRLEEVRAAIANIGR